MYAIMSQVVSGKLYNKPTLVLGELFYEMIAAGKLLCFVCMFRCLDALICLFFLFMFVKWLAVKKWQTLARKRHWIECSQMPVSIFYCVTFIMNISCCLVIKHGVAVSVMADCPHTIGVEFGTRWVGFCSDFMLNWVFNLSVCFAALYLLLY